MTATVTVAQIRNPSCDTAVGAWLTELHQAATFAAPNRAAAAAQLIQNLTAAATEAGELLLVGDTVRGFHPVQLATR